MLDDLRVGDLLKLADALRGGPAQGQQGQDHGMAIVVLDREFIYVGKATTNGDWCYIADASNVRYWGTTKGLGQLVREGPTANTKMDPVGLIKAPMRAVISIIPTREELWNRS